MNYKYPDCPIHPICLGFSHYFPRKKRIAITRLRKGVSTKKIIFRGRYFRCTLFYYILTHINHL